MNNSQDQMITKEYYQRLLNRAARDQSKFIGVKGALSGQSLL